MSFSSVANRARCSRGIQPVTLIWHNEYMQDETITDPPKKEGCVIKSATIWANTDVHTSSICLWQTFVRNTRENRIDHLRILQISEHAVI